MPPPIYQLNFPPHPFWDFVQEMNQQPFRAGAPRPGPPPPPPQPESHQHEAARAAAAEAAEKARSAEASADDPPEVDPSTLKADACKHQRRCARRCGREQRDGFPERGPRRGPHPFGPGPFGPSPFHMGDGPFAGQSDHHRHHPHHPFGPGFRGRGHHHRGGPFRHGGPRGHHHGPEGSQEPGFNLRNFLSDLGSRIGVDLTGAAEGLGIDRFMPPSANPEVDFEPKVDIFDLAEEYLIHTSLPGARKEDVGVDWDGEESVLRLAGVVHRPDVDEVILQHLAVDGRKREVGVFEKVIRLGTLREPANIDISGIKAKMTDGILVIRVPKVEKEHHKRDVPISGATPSPPRYDNPFDDEDREMYDTVPDKFQREHPTLLPERPASFPSRTVSAEPTPKKVAFESDQSVQSAPQSTETKSKAAEAQVEQEKQPEPVPEPLPSYNPVSHGHESDSDSFASDEEGEYVKINVD